MLLQKCLSSLSGFSTSTVITDKLDVSEKHRSKTRRETLSHKTMSATDEDTAALPIIKTFNLKVYNKKRFGIFIKISFT